MVAPRERELVGGDSVLAGIGGEIGIVFGDASRLLRVVGNLLTNAIEFTPRAGHGSVRLERIWWRPIKGGSTPKAPARERASPRS